MSLKRSLLLIGLAVTFMPVSTAFAEDSEEFVACQQMKWKEGKKTKKNCFRDLVRQRESELIFAEDSDDFVACQQMKWKKGKKAKKNCFRDLARQRENEMTSGPSEAGDLFSKWAAATETNDKSRVIEDDNAQNTRNQVQPINDEPQMLVDRNGKDTGFTSITDLCTGVVGISSALKAIGGGDATPISYDECIIEAAECIVSAAQLNPEHEDSVSVKANAATAGLAAGHVVSRIMHEDSGLCKG